MASYFDESEIKKRVTQRHRRQFLFALHVFFALVVFLVAAVHSTYIQETFYYTQFNWILWFNMIAFTFVVGLAPLIPHRLWIRYRTQVEREIERELNESSSYYKRKHEDYTHLSDDGEFLFEQDEFTVKNVRK